MPTGQAVGLTTCGYGAGIADTERHLPAARPSAHRTAFPGPAYAPPVEGAPETGRWVALPILGGVLLGLTVLVQFAITPEVVIRPM